MNGWIGVDLDGTLAEYHGWKGPEEIGAPVPVMLERVKGWLIEGKDVRILTARVSPLLDPMHGLHRQAMIAYGAIQEWCQKHIGVVLPITAIKDLAMIELWDDRCVQVIPNTGERADGRDTKKVTCAGCGGGREIKKARLGLTEYKQCANCGKWGIKEQVVI